MFLLVLADQCIIAFFNNDPCLLIFEIAVANHTVQLPR